MNTMTQWEADIRSSLAKDSDVDMRKLAREVGVKRPASMDRATLIEAIVAAYCPA